VLKIEAAIEIYLNARRVRISEATTDLYRRCLLELSEFLGNPSITVVTIDDLRAYRASLLDQDTRWESHPMRPMENGGLSPSTINKKIRVIKTFFKWLTDEERLDKNPAYRLIPPDPVENPPKEISKENALKMLCYAETQSSARDYAIFCFLANSTSRAYGVATLQIDHLYLERKSALIYYKGRNAQKQQRYVHYNQRTARALQTYLEQRGNNSYPELFIGCRGPLTTRGIYYVLDRIAAGAGVGDPHGPHSFRHAWAMNAFRAGADTATVQKVMGHRTPLTTIKHYSRWAEDELSERHEKFSWFPDEDEEIAEQN